MAVAKEVPLEDVHPDRCDHCGLEVATCRSCGARILWGTSRKRHAWPLDAALTTVAVLDRGSPDVGVFHPVRGHVPHHVTCPQGRAWSGYSSKPTPQEGGK